MAKTILLCAVEDVLFSPQPEKVVAEMKKVRAEYWKLSPKERMEPRPLGGEDSNGSLSPSSLSPSPFPSPSVSSSQSVYLSPCLSLLSISPVYLPCLSPLSISPVYLLCQSPCLFLFPVC